MIIMVGRDYNYNFDRAEKLIDYNFENLLDYNLLEKLLDYNLLENLFDYNLLDYLFENICSIRISTNIVYKHCLKRQSPILSST